MKRYMPIILAVLILGGFYIGRKIYHQPNYDAGEMAPNFSFTNPDGKTAELTDLRSNYILLDFWGSWCGDCRKAHPSLVELYKKYEGKSFKDASGFEIVSYAIEYGSPEKWKKAIKKDGLAWEYHGASFAERSSQMFDTEIAQEYGITWLPTTFLISPKGEIIGVSWSKEKLDDFLSERLR